MKLPAKKMWLWILIAVVSLIVVVFVVGCFLPERYAAEQTFSLGLSPAETWSRLHAPVEYPMSASQCRDVELLPADDGRLVWVEKISGSSLTIREVMSEQAVHIVRQLEDSVVPLTARVEFWLEPGANGGTRVRCKNELRVASGTWHVPLFRVTILLFGGARTGMRNYIRSLTKQSRRG